MSEKLVKKLNKSKERDLRGLNGDEIVKEVETLLLGAHDADLEVLSTLGLDHQVKYDKLRRNDYQRTKKAEELYNRSSFTGRQIEELCGTYYLKILPVRYYNGTVPSDLARTIKEFCEEKNVPMRKDCFFILAPIEQFDTIKRVPRQADPILFYRDPDTTTSKERLASQEDVFTQILNWGNDFSEFRRLNYWFSTYDRRAFDEGFHFNYLRSTYLVIFFICMSLLVGVGFNSIGFSIVLLIPALCIMIWNSLSNPEINREWNTDDV